jgi:predicted ABC-type ATPase
MPTLTVLAGPNGSGKSSIYEKMKDDLPGEFVNAGMIEAGLPAGGSKQERQMQAGRATVTRVWQLIQARQDFVFETTLSSAHSIRVMEEAKHQGYDIGLVFVILRPHSQYQASPLARSDRRSRDTGSRHCAEI